MRMIFRFALLLAFVFSFVGTGSAKKKVEKRSVVRIETSFGVIRVALLDDTPVHRDNFLKLAANGHYNGTLFHRVINEFMIQGGDPDSKTAKPGQLLGDGDVPYTLAPEFQLPFYYHVRGALAAAREGDDVNPEQRSSGSQFYIVTGKKFGPSDLKKVRANLEANDIQMTSEMFDDYLTYGGAPHLDGSYTVFGEVIEGMEVVDQIQKVETDANDRPLSDVVVLSMTVEQKSKDALHPKKDQKRR